MLLKMLTGLSGPLFNLAPGDEFEFDDDEAQRLKDAGYAVDAVVVALVAAKKGKADVVSNPGDGSAGAGASAA